MSRQIVNTFGHIGLETLHIKGMVRNHHLARSISDSGWGMFAEFIVYKGQWYGSYVERFDRFYPSSRLCCTRGCGYINRDLTQGQSSWTCPDCGRYHDRDDNASTNLEPLCSPTVGVTERAVVVDDGNAGGEGRLQGESPVPLTETGSPSRTTVIAK